MSEIHNQCRPVRTLNVRYIPQDEVEHHLGDPRLCPCALCAQPPRVVRVARRP
jgi:hypothetical protein